MEGISLKSFDNSLATLEKGLNVAGYIPLVSYFSGGVRQALGVQEIYISGLLATVKFTQSYFAEDSNSEVYQKEAYSLLNYTVHGFVNIVRGMEEQVFVIGNVACFLYDQIFRVGYAQEEGVKVRFDINSLLQGASI